MGKVIDEKAALKIAVLMAKCSPCEKSQRGAVAFDRETGYCVKAHNSPPTDYDQIEAFCPGRSICGDLCRDIAIHAEEMAMFVWMKYFPEVGRSSVELLHIKVKDGIAVPSNTTSCLRCSAKILQFGFKGIWLLQDSQDNGERLVFYSAYEFHISTLKHHNLWIESP